MKKISILVVFAMFTIAFACSEDEVAPTKTELITNGKWFLKKAEAQESGITIDISADFIQDCEVDDYYEFDADGTFIFNVGTEKCDTEINSGGTWSFNDAETVLNIQFIGLSAMEFNLISVDSKNLKVSREETDFEVEVIRTYSHK